MVRKTRTIVPFDLVVGTRPEVRIQLNRKILLRVVGKNHRTIARVEFDARSVKVFGARERNPQRFRYRELQRKGVSPADPT